MTTPDTWSLPEGAMPHVVNDYTQAWQEMASVIKVGGPLPITFSVWRDGPSDMLTIRGSMWSEDITDGTKTMVNTMQKMSASQEPYEELFFIMAKELYEHELTEWYTCRGDRIRDPHRY